MRKEEPATIQGTDKEFLDGFSKLTQTRPDWQVWADLMSAMSCALSNFGDPDEKRKEQREKEYAECIQRLVGVEAPAHLFAVVTQALERNPDQDYLGKLYMALGLGSHWKGQFFTPFSISLMMAETSLEEDKVRQAIDDRGWISINDPACGAGSTLIAAATALRQEKVNFQQHVAFVGNDVDRVAAQMCFIQMALLGCPGYIAVANTLSDPVVGPVLFPKEKESQEFWYTPMWWSDVWTYRRLGYMMGHMTRHEEPKAQSRSEFFFYFDFDKKTCSIGK